jgi:alpha-tubulin suppressor-like RCC1 family protein
LDILKCEMRLGAWGVGALLGVAACNAVLGLDNYRPCDGGECDGGVSAEGGSDAPSDASCQSSTDCPSSQPVCNNDKCVGVASLATGSSNAMCAVLQDGTMWCWGDNSNNQLGRGTAGGVYPSPRQVSVVTDSIVQGGVGQDFACARTKTDVWCWGSGTAGAGGPNNTYAVKVGLPTAPIEMSVGATGACAIVAGKSVYCWGRNGTGNLSCGDAGKATVPPQSPTLMLDPSADIVDIAVGDYTSCARAASSDTTYCFGDNSWGGLGNGTQLAQPCLTSKISSWATNQLATIAAGDNAVCAIDINGETFCWGQNFEFNNAGIIWPASQALAFDAPFKLPIAQMTQVSVGWLHTCVLDKSNQVTCWGESEHGTTGVFGNPHDTSPPNVITGLEASKISALRQFTCALSTSGAVLCWGNNQFGTLAQPTNNGVTSPQLVAWP